MAGKKKTVLAVVGSPRKQGNSDILCDRVLAGAKRAGARIEKVYLHDLEMRPCSACEACMRSGSGECIIPDGMKALYPKLKSCDALVIASPIYFLSLTAQTTLFLNRCYPLMNPQGCMLSAKKIVACLTYGDADALGSGCDNAYRILNDLFGYMQIPLSVVHASALKKGDINTDKAALRRAYQAGKEAVA